MQIVGKDSKLINTSMARREALKAMAAAGVGVVSLGFFTGGPRAQEQPTLFAWGGYDLPIFYVSYVEQHGQMNFSPWSDEDEAFTKMKAGYTPDVMYPCSYEIRRWSDAGLLQEIDVSRLKNWPDVFEPLAQVPPSSAEGGGRWWTPGQWGTTSITYRTDLVDIEEESWGLLWDERYAGRLAMLDSVIDGVAVAAIYGGIDPWDMTEADIAKVKEIMVAQKPLLRYYAQGPSIASPDLKSGELVAAVTAEQTFLQLKSDGVPVAYMNPKEGRMTWVCGYVLHKNAPNVDLAYELIDSGLEPQSQANMMLEYGYGAANRKAFELVTEVQLDGVGLPTNPEAVLSKGIFQREMANREKAVAMFEDVKAGI